MTWFRWSGFRVCLAVIGILLPAGLLAIAPASAGARTSGWSLETVTHEAIVTGSDDSCTSADWCLSVGSRGRYGHAKPAAQIWNGSTWSNDAPIEPSGSGNGGLSSVSCVSPAFCIAVGFYETGKWPNGPYFTLAEEWDGTGWSVMTTVNPNDVQNGFSGVSCASLDFCLAVGVQRVSTVDTLAEEWDGTSWSLTTTLDPGTTATVFARVSCEIQVSSQEFCVAAGAEDLSENVQNTLAEDWDGTSWSLMSTPTPSGGDPEFGGVSCLSPSFCMAVGGVLSPLGTIVEEWDGASWTLQTAPVTRGKGEGELSDVSCVSDTQCTAVGKYGDGRKVAAYKPLAEGWDGTGWIQQTMATPTYDADLSVQGISCTAAAQIRCSAVGSFVATNHGSRGEMLAEQYVG